MPILDTEFAQAERAALVQVIRSKPEATLADIGYLLKGRLGPLLGTLTVGELIGKDRSNRRHRKGPNSKSSIQNKRRIVEHRRTNGSKRTKARTPEQLTINSRTASGREQYDHTLLETLRLSKRELSAGELRKQVGGTDLQARTALQRLVDEKRVRRTGRARGTRYASIN